MPVEIMHRAERLVAQWRDVASDDNPAGPLYAGGQYAESDITAAGMILTLHGCGTSCSGSYTRYCC